jgi:quercetin dioxygenase-like cupin family protein
MLKRHLALSGLFAAGILAGLMASEIIRAQPAGYSTKLVYKTDLQNLPGQEVLIYASDWPSGFRLPLHMHPDGHEFVYVVEGEQTFEIEGVGTKVVKAGEVIYTPPNTPHFGRNATDRLSKTVVFRIKAKDKPVTVEVKS